MNKPFVNESAPLAFIQAMPKAELHVHLEGAIQPATLLALARRHHRLGALLATNLAGLQRWFTFTDFPHFIQIYLPISDLLRAPDDVALLVCACGADMAAQNVRYRELTFTPFTHTDLQNKKRLAEHPFPHLDRMGLLVTVNSDDPPLVNTSLCQECAVMATEFGYGPLDLACIARSAFVASGAPAALKQQLLHDFDDWLAEQKVVAA